MKVFDEKGKLFGKINIIDLLIIILVIAAIVVVGVKVLGGNEGTAANPGASEAEEPSTTAAKLTYTVRLTAQREETAEWLKQYVDPAQGKKAQLQHGGKLVENAYVVDFWTEPCRYNMLSDGSIEIIGAAEADAAGLVNLCMVVEAEVEDAVSNAIQGQEVRVGKGNIVKTQYFEFANGFVIDCEWEPIEE